MCFLNWPIFYISAVTDMSECVRQLERSNAFMSLQKKVNKLNDNYVVSMSACCF